MKDVYPCLDVQASFYDERWERETRRSFTGIRLQRAAAILYEIALLQLGHPRILDFGCGTGTFTGMLSHVGDVVGVELSPAAMRLAKTRMPGIDFRVGDIFEVGLQRSSFDVIVLQEVIEHVDDQAGLVSRCHDFLKDGGHLILTTPNKKIVHKSGAFAKAERTQTLQPIENLLTVAEARHLVAKHFIVNRCHTVLPAGHTGMLRLLNSVRLTRFAAWRAFRNSFPVGLHTVIVGQKPSSSTKRHETP